METTALSVGALRERLDVASLVPERYARYRPVVVETLRFFLEGLSAARFGEIVAAQLALPADATTAQRVVTLMHQCPTLHKLGQVIARHRELDGDLRRRLQQLETMEPVTAIRDVLPVLERDVGDLGRFDVQLAGEALAEASVAVVVPFTWRDGGSTRRNGVFKVLRPGIEERLHEELAIWSRLGDFLDERCEHLDVPALDYRDTFDSVRDLLLHEIRLDEEQRHLAEASRVYAGAEGVRVPAVLPMSGPRVTAMERIFGRKVTAAGELPPERRRRLADRIVEALIATPIWSADDTSLFHADPHAGNLFVTDDGKLAMLDWSLAGHLGKTERITLTRVLIGAVLLDGGAIERALGSLATSPPDAEALRRVIEDRLRRIRSSTPLGLHWLVELLDSAVTEAGARFPSRLLMFRKALLTLEGVVADVSGDCSIDAALGTFAARAFFEEAGDRLFASPFEQGFRTHVSNADLTRLFGSLPAAGTRFWLDTWRDWLAQWRRLG